jgi:hypothetical protein
MALAGSRRGYPNTDAHEGDLMAELGPWRRYWARRFDSLLALVALTFAAATVAPTSLLSKDAPLAFGFASVILWIPFEALLLASWGSTPGKTLLNVRVTRADGTPLTLYHAFARSLRACIFGMGAEIPLVNLLTLSNAHRTLTETGSTSWDSKLEHTVRVAPMTPSRIALALACGALLLVLLGVSQSIVEARTGELPERAIGLAR